LGLFLFFLFLSDSFMTFFSAIPLALLFLSATLLSGLEFRRIKSLSLSPPPHVKLRKLLVQVGGVSQHFGGSRSIWDHPILVSAQIP